jgi:chromosome segregation ATPase
MNLSGQSSSASLPNSSHNPSTNSSTYPHQQYAGLLTTVNDLRQDLERALNKLAIYEEQNNTISSNYSVIKDELIETRKKYNEIKENYLTAVVQKTEMEKHNEEFLMNIKHQLTEKTKEFELQREKFKPQDIDSIKIKIQEELEFSHQIQLSNIRKEVEQYKEMYFGTKNENELLKVECQMKCTALQRQVEDAHDKYQDLDTYLHEKMKEWSENRHQLQKDETIRNQSIKIHELQTIIATMKEECRNYHAKYENGMKDSEHMNSKHIEMINELRARLKLIESEKFAMDEKVKYMNIDLEKKDMSLKVAKLQVDEYREKNELRQREIDDLMTQHQIDREENLQQQESFNLKHESEMKKVVSEYEITTTKLRDREDMIKRLQRQVTEIQSRFEAQDRDLRRNHLQQTQELQKRNTSIESDLANVKKELHSQVYQSSMQLEALKAENDVAKSEISRLKREKDILHEKLRDSDRRANSNSMLESTINEYKIKESKAQKEINLLKLKLIDVEKAYESLVIKHDHLTREHSSSMELLHQETKARLTALQASYSNKVTELHEKLKEVTATKSKLKHDLEKEKKRSEQYKEKALQAHNQSKMLAGIVTGEDIALA